VPTLKKMCRRLVINQLQTCARTVVLWTDSRSIIGDRMNFEWFHMGTIQLMIKTKPDLKYPTQDMARPSSTEPHSTHVDSVILNVRLSVEI
jgi:hypothetical protein